MARFSQNYDYYDHSPTTLDTKPVFSEDDEASVLDDKILDPNTPDVSNMTDPRRPSYGPGHEDPRTMFISNDFAPQTSHAQARNTPHPASALFDGTNNGFVRMEASQSVTYTQQSSSWPMSSDSGSCTPTPSYDTYPPEYEVGGPVSYSNSYINPLNYSGIPFRTNSGPAPPSAVPMSPQSSQGWMSTASSEAPDGRSLPKRGPTYRPSSPLHMRRDGIRKKNARFEIPAERTLSNIDYLINQSNDDQEIKELKQQKRLLRNRQAALDSRQRKKQHTEKLEEEKKHYTTLITDLEDAMEQMRIREQEFLREKAEWHANQQQCKQYIDSLVIERDEIIRTHTLETADLRKKNNFLTEHIRALESGVISVPSSAGFATSEFSDFEDLAMGNSHWDDDFPIVNDYPMENADHHPHPQPLQHAPLPVLDNTPKKAEKAIVLDGPAGFSWNAFYMCLLFGAFIASNSSSNSTTLSSLPQLSDEYRAESANVLKAVLTSSPSPPQGIRSQPVIQQSHPTTITSAEMARITSGPGSSSLDTLHTSLVAPSKQQETEQLFSLSADQYNSLTTLDDDEDDQDDDGQPHMTTIQAALAAARGSGSTGEGKAEVYSRSLMWDRVPDKVLRDFKAMVKECGGATNEQDQ